MTTNGGASAVPTGASAEPVVPEVRHVPDEERFEIWVGDRRAGLLDYRVGQERSRREAREGVDGAQVWTLLHTETDPEFQGQGLAGRLVEEVFAHVRAAGIQVRVVCPYVRTWLKRHPEAADVVVGGDKVDPTMASAD